MDRLLLILLIIEVMYTLQVSFREDTPALELKTLGFCSTAESPRPRLCPPCRPWSKAPHRGTDNPVENRSIQIES
jgi:hypothetical protein